MVVASKTQVVFVSMCRYCKVVVKKELLCDLLPGPVTLVFERSEVLNTDFNPFTSVSPLFELNTKYTAMNKLQTRALMTH